MKLATSVVVGLVFCAFSVTNASAAVTVMEKDGWKLGFGGFVEMDAIHDSTRSLTETAQNGAIDRPDAVANMAGRTQFSMRNSRLSFNLEAPEAEGWKARGYFEMDFLGFDPSPTTPSASTSSNTEAGYFNNPTLRARHVYLSAESNGWQLLAGQTWSLFGWQPYYFMPTIQVSPVAGMSYARTSQFRAVKTMAMEDGNTVQAAMIIARPPQRDAQLPDLEAGVRYAVNSRTGGFTGGSTGAQKAQPMSIGVTGTARQFKVPRDAAAAPTGDQTNLTAYAMAADALFPILPSSDGKDVSNTLTLGGEYTFGKGYADQMGGWTGNQSNPIANSATAANAEKNTNLDAGYGAFDVNNNFNLIKLRTWNAYLQYHLPAAVRTWLSFGYSNLSSSNINNFAIPATGKFANGKVPYYKDENYFGNVMHDFTSQIRMGFEYAYMQTTYVDEVKTNNNRFQLNAFYLF